MNATLAKVELQGKSQVNKQSQLSKFQKSFKRRKVLYIMLAIPLLHIFIFKYLPMFGIVIAFQNYNIVGGMLYSKFVGFKWFGKFLYSEYFWKTFYNSLILHLYTLIWGFPAPIILALSLNEIKSKTFKKLTQTISYLPHFISTVVIVGIMSQLLSPSTGIFNSILKLVGLKEIYFMVQPEWFRSIYVGSHIWQTIGWGCILYLAALTGIDTQLYEAAVMDGANRWKQTLYITLPGIATTIIILLIMDMGKLLNVGFEKILLMYSPLTYPTADVIDTYVYRRGLIDMDYSFSTAVGLFKSVFGLVLITSANKISKKLSETSLW